MYIEMCRAFMMRWFLQEIEPKLSYITPKERELLTELGYLEMPNLGLSEEDLNQIAQKLQVDRQVEADQETVGHKH